MTEQSVLVLADSFLQRNGTALGLLVSVAIGSIGWAVAWFIYTKGKRRKHLDYRTISDIPIIASGERPEELRVVYGQVEVNNPRITEVRFWNTGNQVIDESDFMGRPFRILPRAGAKLLDFTVLERPTDLIERLSHQVGDRGEYDPGTLLVYPKTLNAGESFTVQLVYDGGDSDKPPTVEGRVRDETRKPAIYQSPEERAARRDRWLGMLGSPGAGVATGAAAVGAAVGAALARRIKKPRQV